MKLSDVVGLTNRIGGKHSLWYLASPYSKYEGGLEKAFQDVAKVAAALMRAGVHVFAPITHSHPIAMEGKLDAKDHNFWLTHDVLHLERCYGLIVARMPGWENSTGVNFEMRWCDEHDRPIVFLDVDDILTDSPVSSSTPPAAAGPSPRLPEDSDERKEIPLARGLIDYFPDALAYVARISKFGNDKHNPGQPIHHARGKSTDHADCIARHLVDRGTTDSNGLRHSGYLAWRALALLQEELENDLGLPLPRAAKAPEDAAAQAAVEGA